MNSKFTPLFQSFTLNNGTEIKNRLVVAPITHFGSNNDGTFSTEERNFVNGRAEDFGLFISAATLVSPEGKTFSGQPAAINDSQLAGLTELAALIKSQGAKAVLQIHHGGKLAVADLTNGLDIVAPSDSDTARALTESEIEALIKAYANAADLALRAGFDGVEIHGANGYLIQQFVSAQSNQRQDQWGGCIENRLRFPLAIVDAVNNVRQKHQRPDFIVGYRFSPEEPGDNGLTMTDTFALIDALVKKPLQYLHISLWDFYKKARRGADTSLTRMQLVHERIGGKLPLIGVGCLLSAEQVLAAYESGWAEFIAVGKAMLINPNFASLIKNGQEDQIITTLDPTKKADYRFPEYLWKLQVQGGPWLPPLKDQDWKPMDI